MAKEAADLYKEFAIQIVPPSWKERAWTPDEYKTWYATTVRDKKAVEAWWEKWANEIFWFKKWSNVLDDSNPPFYRWFVGGETNLAYLATDWQIERGRKNKLALIWEGEPWDEAAQESKEVRKLTYGDLHRESNIISYALREKLKVQKGEILTFYVPMIPELPLYMLAVQRLGARHSIVYSGFSAEALATRAIDAGSRVIVAADGLNRRGKVIPLKPIVDEAVKICAQKGHRVETVIVIKRTGQEISWSRDRDVWHHDLIGDVSENVTVPAERCGSEDFSYVLYTSGTTAAPKGAQLSVGGYAVGLLATLKMIFDVRDDDVYWCTADIGWVTGHSYIVYGPFLMGMTSLMYEGAPDFPKPDRWWSILARHGVTLFYTAPTAIRMLMKFPEELVHKYDLSKVRIAHSVGEPINPAAFRWYYKNVGREDIVASSTWWMTETGHMLTGHYPGLGKIFPLKPGTNGYPLPGVTMEVLDDDGIPCAAGTRGYLAITSPWPGMLMTLFKNPQRYIDTYWSRFKGRTYFYSGDFAVRDQDGYLWILGRADDVLKVAGHRIGTAEIESAMIRHAAVAESACIGKDDPVKGQTPFIFAVLRQGYQPSEELIAELKRHLRGSIGPIVASDSTITFVDSVPKTRSGKIMRRLLKAIVSGAKLGDVTTLEDGVAVQEAKNAYERVKKSLEET